MFYTIKISGEKINCKQDYKKLKECVETTIRNRTDFLNNAKMECLSIVKGNSFEFNASMVSLIVSFSAFYLSMYKTDKKEITILATVILIACIIAILVLGIGMRMKKQNAEKILFIIDKIENKNKIPR